MSSEEKPINVQISAEAAKAAPQLRDELLEVQQAETEEMHRLSERLVKLSDFEVTFFQNLLLLAAGTIALSLTFIGYLHRSEIHPVQLRAPRILFISWFLLLLCIFFCWSHATHRLKVMARLFGSEFAHSTSLINLRRKLIFDRSKKAFEGAQAADLDLGELFGKGSELFEKLRKNSIDAFAEQRQAMNDWDRRSALVGNLAIWCILVAFILLMIFAIKNFALI